MEKESQHLVFVLRLVNSCKRNSCQMSANHIWIYRILNFVLGTILYCLSCVGEHC